LNQWQLPVLALLRTPATRRRLAMKEQLGEAVHVVLPHRPELRGLRELLAVLDDAPFVVLRPDPGTGVHVTISGVRRPTSSR
jgi:hypothetical protein